MDARKHGVRVMAEVVQLTIWAREGNEPSDQLND
jgi:hypothetical protein